MPFIGAFKFEWLDDGVNMQLLNDLTYIPKLGFPVTVPAGEETDGASIPSWLWTAEGSPFTGKYRKAAVVHDYLYRKGFSKEPIANRATADKIFYDAMIEVGNPKFDSLQKYLAVRLFGPRW